mmetsp:Transcript_39336/g.64027  ORF Transcript_39336/g.64027 Transcript_39336/m.64027 type:complete len:219 (-) Transcript_39336:404-1060(-)
MTEGGGQGANIVDAEQPQQPEVKANRGVLDHRAQVGCISRFQSPIQAFLRPGSWIPWCRNIRYHAERWVLSVNRITVHKKFMEAIQFFVKSDSGILGQEKIMIYNEDEKQGTATIYCFTKGAEWLDVLEVRFSEPSGLLDEEKCVATIRSFSSGFIPTSVPLAPLLSVALFWIPFAGNDPKTRKFNNTVRVNQIRRHMQDAGGLEIKVEAETQGCSCL